jgi:hypothetical protein
MQSRLLVVALGLALAGCGPRDLTASVFVDGAPVAVRSVVPSAQLGRDGFIVRFEDGRVLYADFPRAVPATLGVAREADGSDGFRAGLSESGATLIDLCTSDDPATEGSLELRATARARNGYLDLIDGTLRVRFAGCDASYEGVPQGDLELVVELPRR